ncbi:DUF4468 domain-containing protein [Mesonia mobilis]|jgi:hypothetical protein|uniref:DUF4468 domain-containing protein n=1 Tax=Mesonia mobilis TaxID=369791 RepID=UPI0026F12092|nr:DUF4468 domain-containing protein [Mesonia mobilis]
MKKFYLLILLISSITYSQNTEFNLTSNGFEEFVVIETPNKTDKEIFSEIKKWSEYNIRNASKSNYSEIENEFLTYRLIIRNAIDVGSGLMHQAYDIKYDVEIRIKDEKFRIDLKIVDMPHIDGETESLQLTSNSIAYISLFKNNGKLRNPKRYSEMKEQIETSANNLVKSIIDAVNGKSDYKKDEW